MGGETKLKVYCETTFWSYLAGRQTADEKIARDRTKVRYPHFSSCRH